MRWNKWRVAGALAAVAACAFVTSGAGAQPQLTVYTEQRSYSIPVVDRAGKSCIAVADLLAPLGGATPRNRGKEWRFELNKTEVRLTESKDKAAIHGSQFDLGGPVLVEDKRVLVPMAAALPLLTRLLNTSGDFHQPSRRLFIGNALTRFTASFNNGETPSLVLNFTQPVKADGNHEEDRGALFTHTEKTTLTFRKDPVISDVNTQQFGDGAIQSLAFSEDNGTASITVVGNMKLQIVRSDDGKTITLQPEPPAPSAAQTPAPSAPAAVDSTHRQEFFVMIDPSHGGYDRGADFGSKLLEKDVTLRLARELRKELEQRGIAARMLRDSDVDVDLERRAEITNEQRAGIYIALHAGRPGRGVRVYAPFLANPQPPAVGRFLPWESAQSAALDRSKSTAQAVSTELRKKGFPVTTMGMPIRPLNNITGLAIAVELAPETDDLQSLENQKRNNNVAAAIATAIAQIRGQIGTRP